MVPFEIMPLILSHKFFVLCIVWGCLVSNIENMQESNWTQDEILRLCMKNDALFIRRHVIRLLFDFYLTLHYFFFFVTDNLSLWQFFRFVFLFSCSLCMFWQITSSTVQLSSNVLFGARFDQKKNCTAKMSHILVYHTNINNWLFDSCYVYREILTLARILIQFFLRAIIVWQGWTIHSLELIHNVNAIILYRILLTWILWIDWISETLENTLDFVSTDTDSFWKLNHKQVYVYDFTI